jgi:hypothetical protein
VDLTFEKLSESDLPTKIAALEGLKFILAAVKPTDQVIFYQHAQKITDKLTKYCLELNDDSNADKSLREVVVLLVDYLGSNGKTIGSVFLPHKKLAEEFIHTFADEIIKSPNSKNGQVCMGYLKSVMIENSWRKGDIIRLVFWKVVKIIANEYSGGKLARSRILLETLIQLVVPIFEGKNRGGERQTFDLCEEVVPHDKERILTYFGEILGDSEGKILEQTRILSLKLMGVFFENSLGLAAESQDAAATLLENYRNEKSIVYKRCLIDGLFSLNSDSQVQSFIADLKSLEFEESLCQYLLNFDKNTPATDRYGSAAKELASQDSYSKFNIKFYL